MAMGAADLVPGVSGGTIALVTGIYHELIQTINQINWSTLGLLLQGKFIPFWKAINGRFIVLLLSGILTSVVLLSFSIDFLLEQYPIQLNAFFLGLLLASVRMLIQQVDTPKNREFWSWIFLGVLVSFGLTQLAVTSTEPGLIKLFFSGMIAISAMLLPGLSGAYILLVLGVYDTFISTIKGILSQFFTYEWNSLVLHLKNGMSLGLGILVGVRLFAIFLKWVLNRFPKQTVLLLIGLICGALHKIWPWQKWITTAQNHKISVAVWPTQLKSNPYWISAALCLVFGFLLLAILDAQVQKSKNAKSKH